MPEILKLIDHNTIKNGIGFMPGYWYNDHLVTGIYLDGGTSGIKVTNNDISKTSGAG